jgi:hypothetical protein
MYIKDLSNRLSRGIIADFLPHVNTGALAAYFQRKLRIKIQKRELLL